MHVFDKVIPPADAWVKEMMTELGTQDPDKALHALRAGLHALRDRLTVEAAAHLSSQLPLVIRGLFLEGWEPSHKPLRIRHEREFLDLIREKYAPRNDVAPKDIIRAAFHVLRRHTTRGEMDKVIVSLPHELLDLAESARH